MRIEKDQASALLQAAEKQNTKNKDKSTEKAGTGSLYAGDMNLPWDRIEERRKLAQNQAMKIIGDAVATDREMDDNLAEHRQLVNTLKDEISEAQDGLKEIEQRKAELQETYAVDPESEEQKDLELLQKRKMAYKPGSKVSLTKEEKQRLKEIDEAGLTEYQQRVLGCDEEADLYHETIEDNKKKIVEENAIVRGLKQARISMKRQPIEEAQEKADAILDAADREILGMMVEDGMDHIEEEQEKEKEEAEKAEEKQEEKEEQIEDIQEKIEELRAQTEDIRESTKPSETELEVPIEEMVDISQGKTDIEKEIKDLVNKMKLVEEDLKGAAVDAEA